MFLHRLLGPDHRSTRSWRTKEFSDFSYLAARRRDIPPWLTHMSSHPRTRTREASKKQRRRANEISAQLNLFLTWEGNERLEMTHGVQLLVTGSDRQTCRVGACLGTEQRWSSLAELWWADTPWFRRPGTCPYPESDQSSPRLSIPLLEDPFLILSSHLQLGIPSDLFSSGVHTKILYAPLLSHVRATRTAHLILLDLITVIISGEQYRSRSSSLCSLLHSPVTSSFKGHSLTRSAYVPLCVGPSFTPIQNRITVLYLYSRRPCVTFHNEFLFTARC